MFDITKITRIKNHSGQEATVRCMQTGQGYRLPARKSESTTLNIPWMKSASDAGGYAPALIRVELQDGRFMIVFQHDNRIYSGTSYGNAKPAVPNSNVDGNRDLVIGKNGIHIHLEGKSPNMLYGGPAKSSMGTFSAEDATDENALADLDLEGDIVDFAVEDSAQGTGSAPFIVPSKEDELNILPTYSDVYSDSAMGTSRMRHRGTIIALHGFDPFRTPEPRSSFGQLVSQLRHDWDRAGYAVFAPAYDSKKSFAKAAAEVADMLIKGGWPIQRTHYVGYSMGGMVSRVMVAKGVTQPVSLTTICTPHHGTAGWVPTPVGMSDGAMSLGGASIDIHWINNKERVEKAARDRFLAIGVYYQDAKNSKGYHHNDQLIELTSQMGDGLGFGKSMHMPFFEARSPEFPPGGIHGECQHYPMAGRILPHVYEHINAMDQRFP